MAQSKNEWRPIETAPKDGTPILAYNTRNSAHGPVVVRWKIETLDSEVGPEAHWADVATSRGEALYFNGSFFDYWMPLPDVPAKGSTNA